MTLATSNHKPTILIVDDEPDIRELLEITLGRMKLQTLAAADYGSAIKLLGGQTFDLCLTDMQLPDGNGLDLVHHINKHHPELPVAMITAFGNIDTAIGALKAGAFDFLQKPIDLEQLRTLVDGALRLRPLQATTNRANASLLGTSTAMAQLRTQIDKLARSQAPIYLSGESGSGKEVAARLIHAMGPRADQSFVPVNCGAIPTELMESEFFGHCKGSFTGAVDDKQGLFQAAHGGTLFLDEVADLPLVMQVKLLRAIQEKAVRRIGAPTEDATDVRILCATHKDLADEVARGSFRQDLYYRLNVIELKIPALREHLEDLPELAAAALQRLSTEYGGPEPQITPAAMQALGNYDFPGNIRELENILERAFTLCEEGQIQPEDLQLDDRFAHAAPTRPDPEAVTPSQATDATPAPTVAQPPSHAAELPANVSLEEYLEGLERQLITTALEKSRWNKTAAAKALGMTFRALRYKLKKLDME